MMTCTTMAAKATTRTVPTQSTQTQHPTTKAANPLTRRETMSDLRKDLDYCIRRSTIRNEIVPCEFQGDDFDMLATIRKTWDEGVDTAWIERKRDGDGSDILDVWGWDEDTQDEQHAWRLAVTLTKDNS